jgi:transcriptional regulator
MEVTNVHHKSISRRNKMKNFHNTGNCPIREILSKLGNKWSMLVLVTLNANGTMRFNDIHRTIDDISQRMLTVTLRSLETDGLVARNVYAEVPPRVEYQLTERGRSLLPHLQSLVDWAVANMPDILEGRTLVSS